MRYKAFIISKYYIKFLYLTIFDVYSNHKLEIGEIFKLYSHRNSFKKENEIKFMPNSDCEDRIGDF